MFSFDFQFGTLWVLPMGATPNLPDLQAWGVLMFLTWRHWLDLVVPGFFVFTWDFDGKEDGFAGNTRRSYYSIVPCTKQRNLGLFPVWSAPLKGAVLHLDGLKRMTGSGRRTRGVGRAIS